MKQAYTTHIGTHERRKHSEIKFSCLASDKVSNLLVV